MLPTRWATTRSIPELLRAEAEEFGAQAWVILGLAEVRHFVGGGFGADDFDELAFFIGGPASEVGDLRQD